MDDNDPIVPFETLTESHLDELRQLHVNSVSSDRKSAPEDTIPVYAGGGTEGGGGAKKRRRADDQDAPLDRPPAATAAPADSSSSSAEYRAVAQILQQFPEVSGGGTSSAVTAPPSGTASSQFVKECRDLCDRSDFDWGHRSLTEHANEIGRIICQSVFPCEQTSFDRSVEEVQSVLEQSSDRNLATATGPPAAKVKRIVKMTKVDAAPSNASNNITSSSTSRDISRRASQQPQGDEDRATTSSLPFLNADVSACVLDLALRLLTNEQRIQEAGGERLVNAIVKSLTKAAQNKIATFYVFRSSKVSSQLHSPIIPTASVTDSWIEVTVQYFRDRARICQTGIIE